MATALDPETNAEIEARVERGARLLDEKNPGWAWDINLDKLDMSSCYRCVLGQLYDGYSYGLGQIGLLHEIDWEYGFDAMTGTARRDVDEQMAEIDRLWRDEIETRRAH